MDTRYRLLFALLSVVIVCGCTPVEYGREGAALYVSPDGRDEWSGTRAEPDAGGTDGPFATFDRARAALRGMKAEKGLPDGGVTVFIRGGAYETGETLTLTADDSGTESAPIRWCSYRDENVCLTGGKAVENFHPVEDESVRGRLDSNARDHVLVADLKEIGITDFGEVKPGSGRRIELFFRKEFMTIARYPDEGWLTIADVPQTGGRMINKGLDRDKSPVPRGRHYGRFAYEGDRPDRWLDSDDIWVHGYWTWDWSDEYLRVEKIDGKKREITPAEPHHRYGYTKGQRFYFLNILEELDTPGEWYLDRDNGLLYFWPPSEIGPGDAVVSLLETPMISLEGCNHVTVAGITFESSRGNAVRIEGGSDNTVAGCTFRNLGRTAVVVEGGRRNGVLSCDMFELASGGIILDGGDHAALEPAENFAVNNHIHHFDIRLKTYQPGVRITGVGNRAAHNLIHDGPHIGIFLSTSRVGNDHVIEYNELHSLAKETGDVGAIYLCSRDYSFWGNVIRYNYLHHLFGPGLWGVQGVYLDDFTSGTTVCGNIFYKAGRGTLIGGGRNNTIENNIYIDCEPSIHLDGRGLGWAKYYFDQNRSRFRELLEAVNYRDPPYSERYPELLTLLEDDPAVPKYNVISRNISTSDIWFDLNDRLEFDVFTMENNIIGGNILCRWWRKGFDERQTYGPDNPEIRRILEERSNIIVEGGPLFVSPEEGRFELKDGSLAEKIGFEPIPFEKIGLFIDEYRTELPGNTLTAED